MTNYIVPASILALVLAIFLRLRKFVFTRVRASLVQHCAHVKLITLIVEHDCQSPRKNSCQSRRRTVLQVWEVANPLIGSSLTLSKSAGRRTLRGRIVAARSLRQLHQCYIERGARLSVHLRDEGVQDR